MFIVEMDEETVLDYVTELYGEYVLHNCETENTDRCFCASFSRFRVCMTNTLIVSLA